MTDIGIIIAVIGCTLSVATFYLGRQSVHRLEAREMGSLFTDLQYIKESVARIEERLSGDVEKLQERIDDLRRQITNVNGTAERAHENAKLSHSRLNEHLEREHGQKRGGGNGTA